MKSVLKYLDLQSSQIAGISFVKSAKFDVEG